MGVPLWPIHSRKLNRKNDGTTIRKKNHFIFWDRVSKEFLKASFSYFIWLIVFRALSYISVSLRLGYSADVFLSLLHCELCKSLLNILLTIFLAFVHVLVKS